MSLTRSDLNPIWQQFQAVGIADDLQIIEHIAALLVPQRLAASDKKLAPQRPPNNVKSADLRKTLRDLSDKAGSAAELFDRYVLFRLSGRLPGERYPTPRHIVRFMLAVATVDASHSLADFACGSGGFLALRPTPAEDTTTTGYEIAPAWARLAWANCALHGLSDAAINIGNALDVDATTQQYDRVIMNPPFGGQASRGSSKQAGRSETALANLALDALNENGRVCVLTPSGTLFGGGAELALRKKLVDEYNLDAIISLPKDAFQPFSSIQTHLLLATNAKPGDTHATWFLRGERDGYASGVGRDITTEPALANSDLPLLEAVLTQAAMVEETPYPVDAPIIGIKRLPTAESGEVLVLRSMGEQTMLSRIERYEVGNQRVLLINIKIDDQSMLLVFDLVTNKPEEIKGTREQELSDRFGVAQKDLPTSVLLHREENHGSAIAVTTDGRLLGTLVARQVLIDNKYDLRPETYAQAEAERGPLKPPGELLAGIRANQRKLTRRIDGLLGRIEMPPIGDGNILAPVWLAEEVEPLLALLSTEQRAVWERVQSFMTMVGPAEEQYSTPRHFTIADLKDNGISSEVVDRTVELLERIGLIAQVNVLGETESSRVAAYRLIGERDRLAVPAAEETQAAE